MHAISTLIHAISTLIHANFNADSCHFNLDSCHLNADSCHLNADSRHFRPAFVGNQSIDRMGRRYDQLLPYMDSIPKIEQDLPWLNGEGVREQETLHTLTIYVLIVYVYGHYSSFGVSTESPCLLSEGFVPTRNPRFNAVSNSEWTHFPRSMLPPA